MDTLLAIIGIHAALIGFALFFAGFIVIVAPTELEMEALRRGYQMQRRRSWLRGQLFSLRRMPFGRYAAFSRLIERWPKNSQGRKLIYYGVGCLLIAAGVGFHFGLFR
jgi:hypothetical protein